MRYTKVAIESLGYTLPSEIVTTSELERQLAPAYERMRLPEGRLELMTGIVERRFWERGILPGDKSIESGQQAIAAANIDPRKIGMLIHGSVCRDHLEPATACRVHDALGLRSDCMIYDLSNACLGQLNGIALAANAIELGQIEAALIVGTEDSRHLVENTIRSLNEDQSWTRKTVKMAVASLTIGSASSAILLTNRDISQTGNVLQAVTAQANTEFHDLCQSGKDEAVADDMRPLMNTDAERLMAEGIQTGVITFDRFLNDTRWLRTDIHHTFCHQVGAAHRKLMLESLGLPEARDFSTFEWLGNTGSAALPVTLAVGLEQGIAEAGSNLGLLGIGSGINCLMLGASWMESRVATNTPR
ncbi:MAG: 3-oxoacyl-ACP synthase III [Planctomycetaceae bacterium]|nr:3-oxoacyl-ACP synthase III [Planctomycetaceae bacterium]